MATITTCDSRHRVKVPAAIPGKQYLPDGLTLIEVPQAESNRLRPRKTKEEILAAIDRSTFEFTASWEEICQETREP